MNILQLLIDVSGWIYFTAWSISFYPQVFVNYRRKSVVGLSFNFLALNLTGFLCYSIYNACFYFVPAYRNAYHMHHPNETFPILANDVAFSLHALGVTIGTVLQCLIYHRGDQTISIVTIVFLIAVWIGAAVLSVLTVIDKFSLLTHMYYFSTVKLIITIIKYTPQAWYNYQRKSTIGWSITNIILDFTGGTFTIIQMALIAYQEDNWVGIFSNYTKLGLGLLSMAFDVLFFVQHFWLYTARETSGVISCTSVSTLCPGDNNDDNLQEASQPTGSSTTVKT
ncbi:cystinosin-like [Brevipalpus obovatus]|uniref:cystinosin-like n=1 Tax=Brevipalpus obovatus TaxID=246614 RepID=UPI003D9E4E61